ncbi:MAG: hypothetical protein M3275_16820 [Thermoproteota archaeon]|nr:hypothetical protein [Thermoproteota archaeon]
MALRRFDFSEEGKALYGLPYGLEGDAFDPQQPAPAPWRTIRNAILGRNAVEAYGVDPEARRNALSCDAVNELRQGYATDVGTAGTIRPQASLAAPGPRTRRELFHLLNSRPFGP